MPLDTLVQLVNGWGTVPREAGRRTDFPPMTATARRGGVPQEVVADLTDTELERVANALFPVFAAADTSERVEKVADLLSKTPVRPHLQMDAERIEPAWLVQDRQDALLAAAALALRTQLAEHEPNRLGICAADGCADAYIDASPGAHRRFCSITCQNRARVAAFRRRSKSAQ
ncbi:hypothetical protein GCM10009743_37160 [Kribbella swartbergensis]